jgi:hypothetical protein
MELRGSAISATSGPRGVGVGCGADQRDDLVDVGHGHREAGQNVGAVARLTQFEARALGDDFFAEQDEDREQFL